MNRPSTTPDPDPDRFLNYPGPGAHEWWYFDAISEDGRDAVVLVWYAALPFDPAYGVAALRHLRDPGRFPQPRPLDHCAIGLSWYRDGKAVAYALNGYRAGAFGHEPSPFTVEIAGNRLRREGGAYHLAIDTPSVDGRGRVIADLTFRPAPATMPIEEDLGGPHSPHLWILAAPDCRVEGTLERTAGAPLELSFRGRGYHDHNAGHEEMSASMRRWRWGRAHRGEETVVEYDAEPRNGPGRRLRIRCIEGRPVEIDHAPSFRGEDWTRTVFGIRHPRIWSNSRGETWRIASCVDQGPFYLRWLMTARDASGTEAPALGEWLETRALNRPWFNWMIPFRLKHPEF